MSPQERAEHAIGCYCATVGSRSPEEQTAALERLIADEIRAAVDAERHRAARCASDVASECMKLSLSEQDALVAGVWKSCGMIADRVMRLVLEGG